MAKSEQNHDTGLRVLEVLRILLNEDLTRETVIEKICSVEKIGKLYTQEAFLKYFNTLKMLGFKFEKERYKYKLCNALYKETLTPKETEILHKLINTVADIHNKKEERIFQNIIFKLDKYLDEDLQEYFDTALHNKYNRPELNLKSNVVKALENMIEDEQTVKITYRKNNGSLDTIFADIKEITERYVVCYNSVLGRNKKIVLDSIVSLLQTPQKVSRKNIVNSVVFELYGRLKTSYKLKKSEKIIEFSPEYIAVSNTEEDKDILLHRLLKYGENCKIVRPVSLQQEMLEMTETMLKNLGA
ncbi:hypothetical protein IJ182_07935 [bacterium]|nr:hypothetical protein [bacterium]